jgi:transaldolase
MIDSNPLLQIKECGQSIWLDNITRDLLQSGELKRLIDLYGVCGITSNPSIFQLAIAGSSLYDADIEANIRAGMPVYKIYEALIFDDIRNACDILRPVYDATQGMDGYVSIEVPPTIAHDSEATIKEARRYFQEIGRENVMIKIPGTVSGFSAVEQAISEGINVNITLLFSIDSYKKAAEAYLRGLEARVAKGEDINGIASVASFFISRIDAKVDTFIADKLKTVGTESLNKETQLDLLKGKVAIANAKIAYEHYLELFRNSDPASAFAQRWQALADKGAKAQRLLWASTGTKNPEYSDVLYVDSLIGAETVNTLPPATLEACADHCNVDARLAQNLEGSHHIIESLKDPDIGIDIDLVMNEVLAEGIDKFIQPYESLMILLEDKVKKLARETSVSVS